MECGRKMMILRRSPSRWPISNRKVALICLKQNSGDKKKSPRNKNKKKSHFGGRNNKIWLKNDEPLMESNLLTHFQSKSSTNLPQTKFRRQNKTTTETKILKKMPRRMPKRWNLAEKWWTSYGVLSVDPFPIEKLRQFKWNRILAHKKNKHRNENF